MFHIVARTRHHALIANDAVEMCELWRRIHQAIPGLEALCLMLNHLHLVHPRDVREALAAALSGYTRWRNHRRGEQGPLFEALPAAQPLADAGKVRTAVRYTHLNPCRAKLVRDPLAWPFSTHLDAVGLTKEPVRPRHRAAVDFHAYVSSDPSVNVNGTDLPTVPRGDIPLVALLAATSVALRVPADTALAPRTYAREVFLEAARAYSGRSISEIARFSGVTERSVLRARSVAHAEIAALAGDPRLEPLDETWWAGILRHWRGRPTVTRA